MPTRTTAWPAGTACWTDNHVPDLDAARAFYGAVLGWEIDDPDTAAGNFASARLGGRPVAGFLVAVDGAQPGWHVFFASTDIRATAAAVARHGGRSLFGPHPVPPDRGHFQLAADPGAALFGVWQAGSLSGTAVYGEHGSFGHAQLRSSDPTAARMFYRAVFGQSAPLGPVGPGASGEEDRWVPSFVVDDVNDALAAGRRTGGRVVDPGGGGADPTTGELVDPFGAAFRVVTPSRTA